MFFCEKCWRFIPWVDFELDPSLPFQKTIFTVYKKKLYFRSTFKTSCYKYLYVCVASYLFLIGKYQRLSSTWPRFVYTGLFTCLCTPPSVSPCAYVRPVCMCVLVCVTVFLHSWVGWRSFARGVRAHPSDTRAAIVLLSWSIMSSGGWPCSGGRGPITRLITQAWLLLSSVVPGTPQPVAVWTERGRRASVRGEDGQERGEIFSFCQKTDTGCLSMNNRRRIKK